jgi:hypothetical protein
MRTTLSRWTRRTAFVLACAGLVASVSAANRPPIRPPVREPRQPVVVTEAAQARRPFIPPRVRATQMNPIVRIDGTNYRLSVRVIRYLPSILADGQTDIATVPQVMVSLTRVDGQAITRPLNPPMLQLGHPGDRPATVTLARAISNEPQSALWIGEGINNWANDVQLRARLGIQTSRGTVSVNTIADYQVIAAP